MQKNQIIASLKKLVRRVLRTALILLILYFSAKYFLPIKVGSCDKYTQYLNGGVHSVSGISYQITMCGRRGIFNGDNGDQVRMQIHSMQGELLAERWFKVDWDTNFPREIEYKEDRMIYYNPYDLGDSEKTLNIPPTWLDWLRARLP
jgi:hypothetical protein